jgi:plastocyanin
MIGIGMKVRFVPSFADSVTFTPEERRAHTITGKVAWINWEHKTFGAEFQCGRGKMQETFKLSQLGEAVFVCG